jgi:hypothetical protein
MAHQLQHPATEFYYVIVLLLLSYVMSSAPRYVRDLRQTQEKSSPVQVKPASSWKKILAAYTIKPYTNAWKKLQQPQLAAAKPYFSAQ